VRYEKQTSWAKPLLGPWMSVIWLECKIESVLASESWKIWLAKQARGVKI